MMSSLYFLDVYTSFGGGGSGFLKGSESIGPGGIDAVYVTALPAIR